MSSFFTGPTGQCEPVSSGALLARTRRAVAAHKRHVQRAPGHLARCSTGVGRALQHPILRGLRSAPQRNRRAALWPVRTNTNFYTRTRARTRPHSTDGRTDAQTHKRTNARTLSPNRDAKFVYLHGMDNGLGNELLSVVSSFFLARTRVQRFNFISTHITSHHLTRESSTRHIASF